jgi:coproporphyrinogen III oxidase
MAEEDTKEHADEHTEEHIISYLKKLRDQIIAGFESIETNGRFNRKSWAYAKGTGGGEISMLRGDVFEKAAVNWSGVSGPNYPGSQEKTPFFATGVSLITHMRNPKMPTVHFNLRYIRKGDPNSKTSESWLGGGFDLTPMGFEFADDTAHFHSVAEKSLKPFGDEIYPKFKAQAKEYFFIKHYNRERGVGGIFFDFYKTADRQKDLALWRSVGDNFLEAIMPIYHRRLGEKFTEADRLLQLQKRAHYVEFNLLYDRGTRFGFESGGNPEAILCSMPPLAAW